MDDFEIDKLFALFSQFYPNKVVSEELKLAWRYALEPCSYEEVKAAALENVRKSRYFPDIAEIVQLIPRRAEEEKPRGAHAWMAKYMTPEYDTRWSDSGVSRYARENGITWDEAAAALGKGDKPWE